MTQNGVKPTNQPIWQIDRILTVLTGQGSNDKEEKAPYYQSWSLTFGCSLVSYREQSISLMRSYTSAGNATGIF